VVISFVLICERGEASVTDHDRISDGVVVISSGEERRKKANGLRSFFNCSL